MILIDDTFSNLSWLGELEVVRANMKDNFFRFSAKRGHYVVGQVFYRRPWKGLDISQALVRNLAGKFSTVNKL